jgi:hypothetical protein
MKGSKILFLIAAVMVAIICFCLFQQRQIQRLRGERDRYRNNTETLIGDVETYRVRDSLSAARVQALEFSLTEFERFRAEDAALIRDLQARNRDLAAVNKTQSRTIIELLAIPKDTIIIRDSIQVPAVAVHCGDSWFDFDGMLTDDQFTGTLCNRDSLVVAESIRYKRFLGFLWKTNKVIDRCVDVVSKNPHTSILGVEHIIIEK